jgi:tRNA-2-methylthio-N6-dimethylallyladenosine synthase
MIVGFPGETKADFEATLDLMRQVEFDGLFAFMYSDRPNVPARQLSEKIPEPEVRERLQTLLAFQENFTYAKNRALVGSIQEILTEGSSKRRAAGSAAEDSRQQWSGRTLGNKIVHFFCDAHLSGAGQMRPGQLARVRIEKALAHSLWGSLQRDPVTEGLD